VIEHLEDSHAQDPYTAVAYFYISFKDETTYNRTNLTKSLTTQLFGRRPDTPESLLDLRTYHDRNLDPPRAKLERALCSASRDFANTYIIVDGLDECPTAEDIEDSDCSEGADSEDSDDAESQIARTDRRRELVELLKIILGWNLSSIHVLATSRPIYEIQVSLKRLLERSEARVLDLGTESHSAKMEGDISLFIDTELAREKFDDVPEDLKTKVKDDLVKKANGV
jgi:hypothetical protein